MLEDMIAGGMGDMDGFRELARDGHFSSTSNSSSSSSSSISSHSMTPDETSDVDVD